MFTGNFSLFLTGCVSFVWFRGNIYFCVICVVHLTANMRLLLLRLEFKVLRPHTSKADIKSTNITSRYTTRHQTRYCLVTFIVCVSTPPPERPLPLPLPPGSILVENVLTVPPKREILNTEETYSVSLEKAR